MTEEVEVPNEEDQPKQHVEQSVPDDKTADANTYAEKEVVLDPGTPPVIEDGENI